MNLASLLACLVLVACDCVAGGYHARGSLAYTVEPRNPRAMLCTRAQGGSCVFGQVTSEPQGLSFEVMQGSGAGGDELGECNDKHYLQVGADNCDVVARDLDADPCLNCVVDLTCAP